MVTLLTNLFFLSRIIRTNLISAIFCLYGLAHYTLHTQSTIRVSSIHWISKHIIRLLSLIVKWKANTINCSPRWPIGPFQTPLPTPCVIQFSRSFRRGMNEMAWQIYATQGPSFFHSQQPSYFPNRSFFREKERIEIIAAISDVVSSHPVQPCRSMKKAEQTKHRHCKNPQIYEPR